MSSVASSEIPPLPRLQQVADVGSYLEWFFTAGCCAADGPVRVTEGLWTLLTWCWSRSQDQRAGSALCHALIEESGRWLQETDVLEAMARDSPTGNPSRLPAARLGFFVKALLSEGEAVRGQRAHLPIHVEFRIPRFHKHPRLTSATIAAALRHAGMEEERVRYHLQAVHPELDAYRGIWEIALDDRLREVAAPAPGTVTETSCTIPVDAPEFGRRSRVGLRLHCEAALAAYFRLNLVRSPDTP
ncbi:MAG: hypothetical protein E2P00_07355 [Acidobacteria bacterium]|nr:MAG: hypothetical protein E2P00_07355 [Acidobacteriota bacterium]